MVLCGISTCFQVLSPCLGQIVHALLTRPPLETEPKLCSPLDLHVLSTPPAFVLSQDQTLMFNPYPVSLPPASGSPKPSASCCKSGVYSLRNLTVLVCLIYSFHCIVFKDRAPRSRSTQDLLYQSLPRLSTPFFNFLNFLFFT